MRLRSMMLAVLLAAMAAAVMPAFGADAGRNAILISWDGVQREHLKECLAKNELPNLAALVKEGTLVDIDITHKTDTKAGHAQMLTGYNPQTTGVYSNGNFKTIPEGLSIFERLRAALGKDNIKTVMLTAKTHHIGNCPPKQKPPAGTPATGEVQSANTGTGTEQTLETKDSEPGAATPAPTKPKARANAARKPQNQFGEPWYLVYKNMDVWDGEKQRDAFVVGPLALGYLDKYGKDRFFMFFHFSDPDKVGHKFGENSKEENDSYIECDKWLGEIVKELKTLGIYDRTLIFVNSDHGFDEGKKTHGNAPTVFLATNDKNIVRGGNQRAIVPTILTEMGVDFSKVTPPYPGKSLTMRLAGAESR